MGEGEGERRAGKGDVVRGGHRRARGVRQGEVGRGELGGGGCSSLPCRTTATAYLLPLQSSALPCPDVTNRCPKVISVSLIKPLLNCV